MLIEVVTGRLMIVVMTQADGNGREGCIDVLCKADPKRSNKPIVVKAAEGSDGSKKQA